jgi:hypothetical protein
MERLRILGEIPVRKFVGRDAGVKTTDDGQPLDPDGNPDTSFLAKIPADVAFTFQTLDKDGLVLNMAQTWHQLRPGEIRHDCGGCHAHSQKPTEFADTFAARKDYALFDLTQHTPLVTEKAKDESHRKWDSGDATGLCDHQGPVMTVEYHRDIRRIFDRNCVACHTKASDTPAGNLVLDDEAPVQYEHHGKFPGTYYRLALDEKAKFGHKPVGYDSWGYPQASRYVRKLQSRRSLLSWKIFGRRLDGFSNDDHPSESKPGAGDLVFHGEPVDAKKFAPQCDIDFVGSIMPPPKAVSEGKVAALTDEDRRTLVRWIDLGCPIDLDYDADRPGERGKGWMLDDERPTLALTIPAPGVNSSLERILIGAYDFYTGIDPESLRVVADVPIDGIPAGENLAGKFRPAGQGVQEWKLTRPITALASARLSVSVRDKEGNTTRIDRRFSVQEPAQ